MDHPQAKGSNVPKQIIVLLLSVASLSFLFSKVLPLKLLRLLPLLSSTISLQFAYDEYAFLSCWMAPEYREKASGLLPLWFTKWGPRGTLVVFGSFSLSLASGVANALMIWSMPEAGTARLLYMAGVLFVAGHLLLFGPNALGLLAKIRRDESHSRSIPSLDAWLKMHTVRSLLTDLPATVCFVAALIYVMEVY